MQTFNLDLSKKGVIPLLNAKQRDVGTKILINIADNGKEYAIPAGASFSVWFSGKSGEGNYTTINGVSAFAISGNTVTVELIMQMLNNPGEHVMCLIMNGSEGSQLGLWNIPYYVEAIPGADSEIAQQYYQAFVQAQKKAEEAAQVADDAKELAIQSAERATDAAGRAEAAAERAEAGAGASIIVSLDEGNKATHTALEIYNAIQNKQIVVYRHIDIPDVEFISLKQASPSLAVFSKTGYPAEFDIFDIEIDGNGQVSYETHFGYDLVLQSVEKVETDIAPVSCLPQTLTDEQKAQARENIGAVDVGTANSIVGGAIDEYIEPIWDHIENVVHHTPQDLTEEQKAQARENIGAVDEAYVDNAVKGKTYELIETITLEEDVETVQRTQEPDGKAYNFEAVMVECEMAAAASASYLSVELRMIGGKDIGFYINNGLHTNTAKTTVYGYSLYGKAWGLYSNPVPNTWDAPNYWKPPIYNKLALDFASMDRVKLGGGASLPAGSVIKIWGVRADG